MVNKKGFLRIIEATLAVMIVIGAMLLIASQREIKPSDDLTDLLPPILDEIAQNDVLRRDIIVTYDTSQDPSETTNFAVLEGIESFIASRLDNSRFSHSASICDLYVVCPINEPFPVQSNTDIFSAERVISATLDEADTPKRLKIFLWRNQTG
jgi:hypothetical protein